MKRKITPRNKTFWIKDDSGKFSKGVFLNATEEFIISGIDLEHALHVKFNKPKEIFKIVTYKNRAYLFSDFNEPRIFAFKELDL